MPFDAAKNFLIGKAKKASRPQVKGYMYDLDWLVATFSQIAKHMKERGTFKTGYIRLSSPHGYPTIRFHTLVVPTSLFNSMFPEIDSRRATCALSQTDDNGYPAGTRRQMDGARALCIRMDFLERAMGTALEED